MWKQNLPYFKVTSLTSSIGRKAPINLLAFAVALKLQKVDSSVQFSRYYSATDESNGRNSKS